MRTRVRAVLKGVRDVNLDGLVFPPGLTLVGPEELTARCTKALRSPEAVIRGREGYLEVLYDRLGLNFQTYDQWFTSGARIPVTSRR